jgi:transcriptional regulator with XRE-family HTH domain
MANKRRSKAELKEIDALIERLREFTRLNYMTAAEVARRIGVRDTTIYDWLLGQARPAEPRPIAAFLDSLPKENGSGIAPTGYEYREYKNWRGIPNPRRCPFCKQAKGEIRRSRGGFFGVSAYGIDGVERRAFFDSILDRQARNIQFWLERKERSDSKGDLRKIDEMIEWTRNEQAYTVANRSEFWRAIALA